MATTPEITGTVPTPNKTTRDPVIVDMGKRGSKQIKKLKRGQGALMDDVNQVLNELKAAGTISGTVQPVVIVVTEREGRNNFPFFRLFGK